MGPTSRIKELLTESAELSRTDLAASCSLAPSTVSQLVRQLLQSGELEEVEGKSTGGRRPRMLRLARRPGLTGVAEIGSHHARVGLADGDGELLSTQELPIEITAGPVAVFDVLAKGWDVLASELADPEPLIAVGLALPGPVNEDQTSVSGASRMPGWVGANLIDLLTKRFGVPAVIENDARAGALGELKLRPELDDFIYIKAGTGIGASWVSGGVLHRGAHGFGGDLSHTRIPEAQNRRCSCGNSGCLETVGSGAGLRELLAEDGIAANSIAELLTMSRDGDAQVTNRLRNAGRYLGKVLAGVVNFLNPGTIVVGGSLSSISAYVAGLRAVVYSDSLPICTTDLTIAESACGADAALRGMIALTRQPKDAN